MTVMPLMVFKALHVNISNMQSSVNGESNGDAMYSMGYSGLLSSTGQDTNGKKLAISMGCVRNAKNIFFIMAAILGYKTKNQLRITINHLQLGLIK